MKALARVVPRTYIAERLAGALFKYHNYPELVFDGWRPPLHDPLVNISLWRRKGRYANPLIMYYWDAKTAQSSGSLEKQVALYRYLQLGLQLCLRLLAYLFSTFGCSSYRCCSEQTRTHVTSEARAV